MKAIEIMFAIIGVFVLIGCFWAWIWPGVQCVGRSICL